MKKDTYYFPHDYHARNDPKLDELFINMGCEGRGIYWTFIEMLYENNGYLPLSKIDYYANALRTNSESITDVINNYNLFKKDDVKFWSESCLKRLEERDMKSRTARESAMKRWSKDANAMQTHSECNAIKERKGKEKKVKESKIKHIEFVYLTEIEYGKLLKELGMSRLNSFILKLNNYIGSTGKKYKSHYHTILRWVDKEPPVKKEVIIS